MKIQIQKIETTEKVNALIKKGKTKELPSMQDGWKFNFDKQLKKLQNATGYVLVTEESPDIIEGAMIFQMKDGVLPYMAFLEVAPHNRTTPKKYDLVAGCLIAYSFELSVILGVGDYNSILFFDVNEETKKDELKLMAVYSTKYFAKKWDDTTMVILDEDGEALKAKYLLKDITKDDGEDKEESETNNKPAE